MIKKNVLLVYLILNQIAIFSQNLNIGLSENQNGTNSRQLPTSTIAFTMQYGSRGIHGNCIHNDYLIIHFVDANGSAINPTIAEVSAMHLAISSGTGPLVLLTWDKNNFPPNTIIRITGANTIDYMAIDLRFLDDALWSNVNEGDLITITATATLTGANAGSSSQTYYFRKHTKITPYSLSPKIPSLWIPTYLFGTNFLNVPDGGVTFAPSPVGAALGFKTNLKHSSSSSFSFPYVGYSAIFSWVISPTTTNNNYTFSSIDIGGILDLGNYITIGIACQKNLAPGNPSPKYPVMLFGIAPDLLNAIKSLSH